MYGRGVRISIMKYGIETTYSWGDSRLKTVNLIASALGVNISDILLKREDFYG